MTTFNVEFSVDELHQLYSLLMRRKRELNAETTSDNPAIVSRAVRQLEQVSPMLYYVESMVREHQSQTAI